VPRQLWRLLQQVWEQSKAGGGGGGAAASGGASDAAKAARAKARQVEAAQKAASAATAAGSGGAAAGGGSGAKPASDAGADSDVVLVDDEEVAAAAGAPKPAADEQQQHDQGNQGAGGDGAGGGSQQQGGRCAEFKAFDSNECQECGRDMQAALEGAGGALGFRSSWMNPAEANTWAGTTTAPSEPTAAHNSHTMPPPHHATHCINPQGHEEVRAALEQERQQLVQLSNNVTESIELGRNYYLLPR